MIVPVNHFVQQNRFVVVSTQDIPFRLRPETIRINRIQKTLQILPYAKAVKIDSLSSRQLRALESWELYSIVPYANLFNVEQLNVLINRIPLRQISRFLKEIPFEKFKKLKFVILTKTRAVQVVRYLARKPGDEGYQIFYEIFKKGSGLEKACLIFSCRDFFTQFEKWLVDKKLLEKGEEDKVFKKLFLILENNQGQLFSRQENLKNLAQKAMKSKEVEKALYCFVKKTLRINPFSKEVCELVYFLTFFSITSDLKISKKSLAAFLKLFDHKLLSEYLLKFLNVENLVKANGYLNDKWITQPMVEEYIAHIKGLYNQMNEQIDQMEKEINQYDPEKDEKRLNDYENSQYALFVKNIQKISHDIIGGVQGDFGKEGILGVFRNIKKVEELICDYQKHSDAFLKKFFYDKWLYKKLMWAKSYLDRENDIQRIYLFLSFEKRLKGLAEEYSKKFISLYNRLFLDKNPYDEHAEKGLLAKLKLKVYQYDFEREKNKGQSDALVDSLESSDMEDLSDESDKEEKINELHNYLSTILTDDEKEYGMSVFEILDFRGLTVEQIEKSGVLDESIETIKENVKSLEQFVTYVYQLLYGDSVYEVYLPTLSFNNSAPPPAPPPPFLPSSSH